MAVRPDPARRADSSRSRHDQLADPVAQLEREVRRRGAHQLAHVLDRDAVLGPQATRLLGFGHRRAVYAPSPLSTAWISSSASIRACTSTETASSSPIIQPWL